jgi:hypothetical protein
MFPGGECFHMTGIVLEVKKKTSIILGSDGQVYTIKRTPNDSVGKKVKLSEEQTKPVNMKRTIWNITTWCLTISILILLGVLAWQFFNSESMEALVQVDVETSGSLFFTIDQYYMVVKLEAKDENGQKILQSLKLKDLSLERVLEEVFRAEGLESTLCAAIAVTCSDAQNHIRSLPVFQELSMTSASIDLFYVHQEQWDLFVSENVAPAKAVLIQSLWPHASPDLNQSELASKSVRDIRQSLLGTDSDQMYEPQEQNAEEGVITLEGVLNNGVEKRQVQGLGNEFGPGLEQWLGKDIQMQCQKHISNISESLNELKDNIVSLIPIP